MCIAAACSAATAVEQCPHGVMCHLPVRTGRLHCCLHDYLEVCQASCLPVFSRVCLRVCLRVILCLSSCRHMSVFVSVFVSYLVSVGCVVRSQGLHLPLFSCKLISMSLPALSQAHCWDNLHYTSQSRDFLRWRQPRLHLLPLRDHTEGESSSALVTGGGRYLTQQVNNVYWCKTVGSSLEVVRHIPHQMPCSV